MQSSSRNKTKVRVLAVHTTEGIMRAVDLRAWKSWPGSSHASADETGVLLAGSKDGFVDYELAAWTLRSGNPWSENIELCGWAKWKRDEWLARPLLLDACARWLAERAVARGIPLVKLSPKEYASGRAGVIGHVDHTIGYSDGTHTDPGPNFPYDVVLAKAAEYAGNPPSSSEEFTVAQYDDIMAKLEQIRTEAWQQHKDMAGFNGANFQNIVSILVGGMPAGRSNFHWVVDQVQAMIATIPGATIDTAALEKAVRESLANAQPVDVGALADALSDEADRRARDNDPATGPVS